MPYYVKPVGLDQQNGGLRSEPLQSALHVPCIDKLLKFGSCGAVMGYGV